MYNWLAHTVDVKSCDVVVRHFVEVVSFPEAAECSQRSAIAVGVQAYGEPLGSGETPEGLLISKLAVTHDHGMAPWTHRFGPQSAGEHSP